MKRLIEKKNMDGVRGGDGVVAFANTKAGSHAVNVVTGADREDGISQSPATVQKDAKRNGCGNVDGRGFGTAPKTQSVIAVSKRLDAKSSVMGSERSTPQKLSVNSKLLETKRKRDVSVNSKLLETERKMDDGTSN